MKPKTVNIFSVPVCRWNTRFVRKQIISNAFMLKELYMAHDLEIVTHAPAYNVGLCLVQQDNFPTSLIHVQKDLVSCVMTPCEEIPEMAHSIYDERSYVETDRGIELFSRIRRYRRRQSRE